MTQQPKADGLDALKRNPPSNPESYDDYRADELAQTFDFGWNSAIDHLAQRGMLQGGWQPIESAPMDGTYVIVMYMHIDTQVVHNAFYASEEDGWEIEDLGWWSYEHSEVSRIKLDDWMTPTHWMPLPAGTKMEGKE